MPANPEIDKHPSKWLYWLLAVSALVAGFMLYLMNKTPQQPPTLEAATLLIPAKIVAPQGLVDHDGKPFASSQLHGHYSFIFFGYTHCPDVCPATLYQFKTVAKMLQSSPDLYARTRFILVSVDPQRDTSAQLKEYVKYYHPDFIGVTGPAENIKTFSRQMGVIYERREPEDKDGDNYIVDHSSAILMTNPDGHLQVIFSAPHNAEALVRDYQSIYNFLEGKP
jgi:protein SCO1/2